MNKAFVLAELHDKGPAPVPGAGGTEKKGGTTDDDGLENVNRKKRRTSSESEIEQHKVMARQECLAFVGSPGQSSVKRRKMLTLSHLVQCVHYKITRD